MGTHVYVDMSDKLIINLCNQCILMMKFIERKCGEGRASSETGNTLKKFKHDAKG